MWHARFGRKLGFMGYGPWPFGFHFHGARRFPRREEYLRMLEEYKQELEAELKEIEEEIEELRGGPKPTS